MVDTGRWVGHTVGMTTTAKLAISLPQSIADRARRAVRKGHAASLSAYVAAALEEKTKNDDLQDLIDDMLAETGGPMTRQERARAADALGLGSKRKAR